MDAPAHERSLLAVCTADQDLLDQVLSVTAAAGLDPVVTPDAGDLRPVWNSAGTVLVGADQASSLVQQRLPRRSEVYLLSGDAATGEASRWSGPLGAALVTLPTGLGWLSAHLTDAAGPGRGAGRMVAFVGASGGLGTSTCAAAVGVAAARRGIKALLVDGDPGGGGIDLLLGAEHVHGWRWPRLAAARGRVGDLSGQLPQVDGLSVLSHARSPAWDSVAEPVEPPDPGQLREPAWRAVLGSATRSHDLVVLDLARGGEEGAGFALATADVVVVLAAATVRGAAAARDLVVRLADQKPAATSGPSRDVVLVRLCRGSALPPDAVAESIGLPLLGAVVDDPRVARAAERGEPPGRSGRDSLGDAVRAVLERLDRSLPAAVGSPERGPE